MSDSCLVCLIFFSLRQPCVNCLLKDTLLAKKEAELEEALSNLKQLKESNTISKQEVLELIGKNLKGMINILVS